MQDYSQYLIKSYKYWKLMMHGDQGCIGRCVVKKKIIENL